MDFTEVSTLSLKDESLFFFVFSCLNCFPWTPLKLDKDCCKEKKYIKKIFNLITIPENEYTDFPTWIVSASKKAHHTQTVHWFIKLLSLKGFIRAESGSHHAHKS